MNASRCGAFGYRRLVTGIGSRGGEVMVTYKCHACDAPAVAKLRDRHDQKTDRWTCQDHRKRRASLNDDAQ